MYYFIPVVYNNKVWYKLDRYRYDVHMNAINISYSQHMGAIIIIHIERHIT